MKRRQLLAVAQVFPTLLAWPTYPAWASGRDLPTPKSLKNDLDLALKKSKPLVVLVSLDHCPFCKIARENYLIPLMAEQMIPVVQVNLAHVTAIVDAHGNRTTQAELIKTWQVKVTPTVLFLGKNGQEIAPRLEGGSTSDFYGAYLDERVRTALSAAARL
jgi:thioredoxin-related protein